MIWIFNIGDEGWETKSKKMEFEQDANDKLLICMGFIVLGFLFIIAATYGVTRSSSKFKYFVAIFVVYELIAFIFFNIIYV